MQTTTQWATQGSAARRAAQARQARTAGWHRQCRSVYWCFVILSWQGQASQVDRVAPPGRKRSGWLEPQRNCDQEQAAAGANAPKRPDRAAGTLPWSVTSDDCKLARGTIASSNTAATQQQHSAVRTSAAVAVAGCIQHGIPAAMVGAGCFHQHGIQAEQSGRALPSLPAEHAAHVASGVA